MSTVRFHRWLLNVGWVKRPAAHLSVFFLIGLVSTVSLSSQSQVDDLAPLSLSIGQKVEAQSVQSLYFSPEAVDSYADALLKIETIRQQTLSELEVQLDPDPVPDIACHDEQTLQGLSSELQQLVVQFCEQSIVVVQESGLSVTQFNQMTAGQKDDLELAAAVQDAIARLQQPDALIDTPDVSEQ